MKLTDLNPRWVGAGGEGVRDRDGKPVPAREGVGITFDCPCGCGLRPFVGFANPLDGGPPHADPAYQWRRTGDDFASLTLHPSIKRHECGWHGWVKDGDVTGRVEP